MYYSRECIAVQCDQHNQVLCISTPALCTYTVTIMCVCARAPQRRTVPTPPLPRNVHKITVLLRCLTHAQWFHESSVVTVWFKTQARVD